MSCPQHTITIRVRYSETDQMGTYYNSRALEWFECGRSETLRAMGRTYREMEAEGLRMPLREAHVEYLGKAQYDDELQITSRLSMSGKARLRFDIEIRQADSGKPVCRGWTEHVVTDTAGKAIRPPKWLVHIVSDPSP
jgi:acyl-CoA thioester hydrolase